jgi:hypothetical protein
MAIHFYLGPDDFYIIPGSTTVQRVAKYFTPDLWHGNASFQNYGAEPVYLIAADVTPAQHAFLIAQTDIVAAPPDLSDTVGANLSTLTAILAARNIPFDWIGPGMTWATLIVWIWRLFFLFQTFERFGKFFDTLDLTATVSQFSQTKRNNLAAAAQSIGLDTSGITGAMTIQQALKILGNQIQVPPFQAGVRF